MSGLLITLLLIGGSVGDEARDEINHSFVTLFDSGTYFYQNLYNFSQDKTLSITR